MGIAENGAEFYIVFKVLCVPELSKFIAVYDISILSSNKSKIMEVAKLEFKRDPFFKL